MNTALDLARQRKSLQQKLEEGVASGQVNPAMKQLLEAELLGLGKIQVELVDYLTDLQQYVAVSTPAGTIGPDITIGTVSREDQSGSQETVATSPSTETAASGETPREGKEEITKIPRGEVGKEQEGNNETTLKTVDESGNKGIDIDDIFGGGLPGGYGQDNTEDNMEEVTVVPMGGGQSTTQKSEALASGQQEEDEVTEDSIIILPSTKSPPLDCGRNE